MNAINNSDANAAPSQKILALVYSGIDVRS
jgi:hypothetical protein